MGEPILPSTMAFLYSNWIQEDLIVNESGQCLNHFWLSYFKLLPCIMSLTRQMHRQQGLLWRAIHHVSEGRRPWEAVIDVVVKASGGFIIIARIVIISVADWSPWGRCC